jgi:D-galactarate dehydratase/Altronate hydrolase, second domain
MAELRVLRRPDGRSASRAYMLVVPSVVCSNAVSLEIARHVPGAIAVTHQHGCAQIGDDARLTSASLEQLGLHPNAWATVVVSLGCETLQGTELARRLQEQGALCAFVGIQSAGGSAAAVDAGVRDLGRFETPAIERSVPDGPIAVGVAFAGPRRQEALGYASALSNAGFDVFGPVDSSRSPVLTAVELAMSGGILALVIVGDRLTTAPVLTPLLSVATDAERFGAAEGEFDLLAPGDTELVDAVTRVISGEQTAAERRGDAHFSVRRTLVTL